MLIGGMSGGMGKFAGGMFGHNLVTNSLVGGVTGGVAAEINGGKFGEGFFQGSRTAAFGYLFNGLMHDPIEIWINNGKYGANYISAEASRQPSYIDTEVFWGCMAGSVKAPLWIKGYETAIEKGIQTTANSKGLGKLSSMAAKSVPYVHRAAPYGWLALFGEFYYCGVKALNSPEPNVK